MKNSRLPILFDAIIVFLSFLTVGFVVLRINLKTYPAFLYALFLATGITAIIVKLSLKKYGKTKLKKEEELEKQKTLDELLIMNEVSINALLEKAVKNSAYNYNLRDSFVFLKDKNALLFPSFCADGLKKSDIIRAYNLLNKTETAFILTAYITEDVENFAKKFSGKIKIMTGSSVYKFLKKADALPTFTLNNTFSEKQNFFKEAFVKGKSLRYFMFSLLLLLSSFLTPYKAYYIIAGGALMTFSLFCRFYGRPKINGEEL